jgi:hypothetical protein
MLVVEGVWDLGVIVDLGWEGERGVPSGLWREDIDSSVIRCVRW